MLFSSVVLREERTAGGMPPILGILNACASFPLVLGCVWDLPDGGLSGIQTAAGDKSISSYVPSLQTSAFCIFVFK